jgi:PAS domain S-box-containing protein
MPGHVTDALFRQIVENASDAVVFADREGLIRLWNAGAELLFGFTAAEVVGRSMDLIIPERLRARHWDGYHKVMETGTTRYGREILAVPAVRKDGSTVSIEFTIQLLRDDAGAIVGPVAIIRDVTARWKREKELNRRVKELEARMAGGAPAPAVEPIRGAGSGGEGGPA